MPLCPLSCFKFLMPQLLDRFKTRVTPSIKDNTRLFQSFTAVAGTVWIRLPANLPPRLKVYAGV